MNRFLLLTVLVASFFSGSVMASPLNAKEVVAMSWPFTGPFEPIWIDQLTPAPV